jgi:hypothetical protein
MKEIRSIDKNDIVVAELSALACLFALLKLPVWAVFIGWVWYLSLGSKPSIIRPVARTAVLSGGLAILAIILTDALSGLLTPMGANMAAVFVTILGVMILLKNPANAAMVSFNAFSCIFAGYYLGAFPVQENYWLNLLTAFACITGSNILGLFVAWLHLALTAAWTKHSQHAAEHESQSLYEA